MPVLAGGYPASPDPTELGIRTYTVPGSVVRLNVRSDIAPLLIGAAAEFHTRVEALIPGQCGGYNYRHIDNDPSKGISRHGAGIAIDLNSARHPNNKPGTFTAAQAATCRDIASRYGLLWGGDFRSGVDEMHFEVTLPLAQARALAGRLPGRSSSLPVTAPVVPADVETLQMVLVAEAAGMQTDLTDAVTGTRFRRTMDGAISVALTVIDPKRTLIRRLAQTRARMTVAGNIFELSGVRKTRESVDLTFEDQVAASLRRHKGFLTIAAGTMTRTDFARKLVADEPWVQFIGQTTELVGYNTRGFVLSPEPLSRGTEKDPNTESSWDAIGRLAEDIGWRRFSDGRAVYFASDAWLAARADPIEIHIDTPGVDDIDWDIDVGQPASSATITGNFTRQSYPPGYPVLIRDLGPVSGLWLIKETERALDNPQGTVELERIFAETYDAPTSSAISFGNWPGTTIEPTPGSYVPGQGFTPDAAQPDFERQVGQMSGANVAKFLHEAGFTGDDLIIAVAVARAESGWVPGAINDKNTNGSVDRGLMQINSIHKQYDPLRLLTSAAYNATAAYAIFVEAGHRFTPWVAYKNGSHRQWLDVARTAVMQAGIADRAGGLA